jgi:ferritin
MSKIPLAPKLVELFNREVGIELKAHNFYTQLATWADSRAFPGLTEWADKQAGEEDMHAQRFIEYLRDRAYCTITAIPAPPMEYGSYLDALKTTLQLEQSVTAAIGEMYTVACAETDGATVDLLLPFLKEQIESERNLEIYIMRVERNAPIDLLDHVLFE